MDSIDVKSAVLGGLLSAVVVGFAVRQFSSHDEPSSEKGSVTSSSASSQSNSQSSEITIAYWKIRGLGAPLRMVASYANAKWKPEFYELKKNDKGEPTDRSNWTVPKKLLEAKNPLINLPYIIDGDTLITQTNACLTYLGRKFGLNGETEGEVTRTEQVLSQAMDLRNDCIKIFYSTSQNLQDKMKEQFYKVHYDKFENWLAMHKFKFSAADKPTIGDFHLFELLDQLNLVAKALKFPSPLQPYPLLTIFHQRFKALQQLQKYFESDFYRQLPLNQPWLSPADFCVQDYQ